MQLSAPIYRLKRQAKLLSRSNKIPLHMALDELARQEGFNSWSLLAAQAAERSPGAELFERVHPGQLILLGARPGQGKTLMSLEFIVAAVRAGHDGLFFTLEYTEAEVLKRLGEVGANTDSLKGKFFVDTSDAICADYIISSLTNVNRGAVAVVDYLQLLDQRREHPSLEQQVKVLRLFAKQRGVVIVFIAQIDRHYDGSDEKPPSLEHVRLPNHLDLGAFDKTCFINNGLIQLE